MIRNIQLPTFLLLIFALFSCRNDALTDPIVLSADSSVYAGISDSSFLHHDLIPNLQVSVIWDSMNLYAYGSDSMDLDQDGDYDIGILLRLLNSDSLHLLGGSLPDFPYLRLQVMNGFEIALATESFPIGLGQMGTAYFADSLAIGQRIDNLNSWHDDPNLPVSMWAENPNNGMTPSFGAWYSIPGTFYLAFRKGGKYGWIEVDATDRENMVFSSHAIQR